jgi:hypothetical protein
VTPRKVVGVCAPVERVKRARLFSALEEAFPVRFEERQPGEFRDLDALIAIGDDGLAATKGLRSLVMRQDRSTPTPGVVQLSTSPLLDGRLRGWALSDARAGGLAGCASDGPVARAVASCGRAALWLRGVSPNGVDHTAAAPEELESDEPLRDALVPGRWLALLPLVHFLREVCADLSWTPPPPRASFIVDDPNLHWPSYGHLRFAELARHGQRFGYHVAIATIPLDAWLVNPRAARLFREQSDVLSLLAHGNDHVHAEFIRPRPNSEALRLLAQASRRLTGLERRAGIEVSRLMVAPFGLCSAEMMGAMLRAGFEGLCHSWPIPRAPNRLLAGWEIADLAEGGFPVFPRFVLTNPRDELVFRSYLDQPLILYGHHWDFADGLDILSEASAHVDRAGPVAWMSPGRIGRLSFATRMEGTSLRVRPYARSVTLDLPVGVEQVIVELPSSHGEPERETAVCRVGHASIEARSEFTEGVSNVFEISGGRELEIRLIRNDAVDLAAMPLPPRRPGPYARRAATEGRDRLAPLSSRLAHIGVLGLRRRVIC